MPPKKLYSVIPFKCVSFYSTDYLGHRQKFPMKTIQKKFYLILKNPQAVSISIHLTPGRCLDSYAKMS